jgi:hypothetical protein
MKQTLFGAALIVAASLAPGQAQAKVAEVSDRGFVVRHIVQVPATPEETWALLVKPSAWWDSAHTWSSDAANLTLDARPGGCFCEVLPGASAKASPRGGVEHMRVIYVEKPRALRMTGALGPLQADAATGTMTIQLKPVESANGAGATQILVEYVVGGYTRTPFDKLAPAVDGVVGAQFQRLATKLGGTFSAAFPPVEGASPEAPPAPESEGGDDGVLPLPEQPPEATGPIIGR